MTTSKKHRKKHKWEIIADWIMKTLMEEGVPYHKGISDLIMELEFHYQTEQGDILSSTQQADLFIKTDVRFHSEALGLSFEVGKDVFYYWAALFHPEDYKRIMSEKISNGLKKIVSSNLKVKNIMLH